MLLPWPVARMLLEKYAPIFPLWWWLSSSSAEAV